jgi:hypothetical protein
MSWNSSHSVGWSDATISTFVGWVQRPEFSKEIFGWTNGIGTSSSDALGFGNSKGQSSAFSALDDPTLWPAVYPMLAFKSYRDALKYLLQHRMNRRFRSNSAVHLTPAFELHSTASSGCSSAPDGPTRCRCNASVHWLGHLVQRLYQRLWVTGWFDASAGGNHRFIRRYYFSGKLFQRLASLARTINMTPCLSWAAFATLQIYYSQGEKESVFLPFGNLFLFIEELFLSAQGFSWCIHGWAECSGQVKVYGLVTLGVWRLLDGVGALGVLDELFEIVGAQEKLGVHGSRPTVSEMENGYS